jgi:hypothetical protein
MRLSQSELTAIIESVDAYVHSAARLLLYGSRVDDSKRGGDIDLLLEVNDEQAAAILNRKSYIVLAEMKNRIGDQKIDFLICTPQEITESPFLRLITKQALLLHEWSA